MDRVSLQYLGVPSPGLLAFLLIAICLALLGGAVWQFIKGRYRHAVACLAAVLPPTLVPVGGPTPRTEHGKSGTAGKCVLRCHCQRSISSA